MRYCLRLVVAGLIGIAAGGAIRLAAGVSLGLFAGPLFLAALVCPYLRLIFADRAGRGSCILFMVGTTASWWFAGPVSAVDALRCLLVLLAFGAVVSDAAALSATVFRSTYLGAAIPACVALAWLTWPIWLSHALSGAGGQSIADWLVPIHPPLVINGVVAALGPWTEQTIAYRLTNLGQDVYFALPRTIWPCVAVHLAAAAVAAALGCVGRFVRARRSAGLARG